MEKEHILTCLECGNSAVSKQQSTKLPMLYFVECQHCGQEGRVKITPDFRDSDLDECDFTEVRDGNFAFLSENGLSTLRNNMDDFQMVSYEG